MNLELDGAAVLVTGASRGLGRALALAFAAEGARVAICARNAARLASVAEEIKSRGGQCLPLVANLFHGADCRRIVDDAAAAFGRLDVLINNASTVVDGASQADGDDRLLERVMGKTMAAIRCSQSALSHMRKCGGGRIVCIGGSSARSVFRGREVLSSGSAIPSGLGNSSLANYVKHLWEEAGRDRITVNIVHPHVIRTDRHPDRIKTCAREWGVSEAEVEKIFVAQIPMGRLLETSDVVPMVMFLASPQAGAITGQSIAIDGGAQRVINY